MFRKLILILSVMVISVVMSTGGLYASSFADTYGFSATGMSMGNAMTAVVNDWSSVYYNIAGLGKTMQLRDEASMEPAIKSANLEKLDKAGEGEPEVKNFHPNQLAISSFYTKPALKINISRYDSTTGKPLDTNGTKGLDFAAAVIGVAVDINNIIKMPSFISSARYGLGLGTIADGSMAKANDIDLKTHDYLRYGREVQSAVIITGLGYGFAKDAFGIGAGARISFSGSAQAMMTDVELGSGEQRPQSQAKMDLKAKPTLVAGVYISPGKILSALDGLDFGFCYRHENYLKIDPYTAGTVMKTGSAELSLIIAILDFYVPDIYTAGVSYKISSLTIAVDAEYQMWSGSKVSSNNKINYDKLAASDSSYRIPKLHDIIIPKVGLKLDAAKWLSLMAGYYYQPSFLPKDAGAGRINFLDNDTHVGSAGLQFHFPKFSGLGGPIDLTLFFQGQYLVEKTVTKNDPTPENPNYTYGGFVPTFGLELSMKI